MGKSKQNQRIRKYNRFGDWRKGPMILDLAERCIVVHLINAMKGVSKNAARMVDSLYEDLDLGDAQGYDKTTAKETGVYQVSALQLQWIRDRLDTDMDERNPVMPPQLCRHALRLYDDIVKELDVRKDKPHDASGVRQGSAGLATPPVETGEG